MKKLMIICAMLIFTGTTTASWAAGGCGAVASDGNGDTVSCIGTKKCKAKAGKWVKCDGKKTRL